MKRLAVFAVISAGVPIVLVGDFNSGPTDQIVFDGVPIVPPYLQLAAAGYVDTWTLRPGRPPGFTCCQMGDLLNPASLLFKRIDHIFSNVVPAATKANIVGDEVIDLATVPLWPSDHAGVAARVRLDE